MIVNESVECLEFANALGNLRLGVSSCIFKSKNLGASLYEPLRCYKVPNPFLRSISRNKRDIPPALVAHYRRQLRCLPVRSAKTDDKTKKTMEER
ncbi:Uncharacterized protein DBV15_07550 [Temnothorax longispinosus]|uniref:Uncharacterized protein n=1 Tax=Temnothorax longispinosus TaxID=300112 RepID=A0A4S2KS45_9HYME|nr:Uncharacterized protein DBV15_07550 [Temnothorax longispinosus]